MSSLEGERSISQTDESPLQDRARAYGWARRAVYGQGGIGGAAWREAARPLGWVYGATTLRRLRRGYQRFLPAPTISVGNVTVGGGGKTSLVMWLVKHGLPASASPAVLSRGYGRSGRDIVVIPPGAAIELASIAGDEPVLLARSGAWVGVGADREETARAVAERTQPDCYVLDDGLQTAGVGRLLDLVVFTADDLGAPARCLPAGPLRQGPDWRPRTGAWVVVGLDPNNVEWPAGTVGAAFGSWWRDLPGTTANWRDIGTLTLSAWLEGGDEAFVPRRSIVAFTGVARPESVPVFARGAGFPVAATVAFPDHHAFSRAEVERLLLEYPGAALLTTEKDAVKCDPEWFGERPVGVLRRRLEPSEPDFLRGLIAEVVNRG